MAKWAAWQQALPPALAAARMIRAVAEILEAAAPCFLQADEILPAEGTSRQGRVERLQAAGTREEEDTCLRVHTYHPLL